MSHNLTLTGYDLAQTTTEFTWRALAVGDRFKIAEMYRDEYIMNQVPPPLRGRDARNAYMVRERERRIAELHAEYRALVDYLHANPTAKWGQT